MKLHAISSAPASVLLALVLCGCATGAKFTTQNTPRDGGALLYVYRPSSPPYLLRPTIVVNGTEAAKLGSKRYFELSLNPGSYVIKADWFMTSGVPDSEMTLQAEAGQTYYLCVLPSMHNTGYVATGFTVAPIYDFENSLELMDGNVALPALEQCSAAKVSVGADTLINPK